MFTKPTSRVRVTARDYEGGTPGKSKTITLYGTSATEVIKKLVAEAGRAGESKTAGRKRKAS